MGKFTYSRNSKRIFPCPREQQSTTIWLCNSGECTRDAGKASRREISFAIAPPLTAERGGEKNARKTTGYWLQRWQMVAWELRNEGLIRYETDRATATFPALINKSNFNRRSNSRPLLWWPTLEGAKSDQRLPPRGEIISRQLDPHLLFFPPFFISFFWEMRSPRRFDFVYVWCISFTKDRNKSWKLVCK